MGRGIRAVTVAAVGLLSAAALVGCSSQSPAPSAAASDAHATGGTTSDGSADATKVARVAAEMMATHHLRSIEVAVVRDGKTVFSGALGESLPGEAATTDMYFRNGAFAFTYLATLALVMVDQHKLNLDDTVSKFLPSIPHADKVTVKQLLNMTSGYTDYVYSDQVLNMGNTDPFYRWTSDQLIEIGATPPLQFTPGTNWGYSHTNYLIVGKLLAKVTGMTLNDSLEKYVLKPMGLDHTQGAMTAALPSPVMHTYSSERREALGVPTATPFYEESTFWDPSWTVPAGAIESTTIFDLATSMNAVARGTILSKASHHAQTDPLLTGFGHKDPACAVCNQNTDAHNYGLGVVNEGQWVTQTMNFSGHGATAGGLASQKLSIAVSTTYAPSAFDATGGYRNASNDVFESLAYALAPGTGPTPRGQ
ncbi:serine hydrolase domain-containing protein [Rathayibacter soli]|uniref:serine hydrolase domain-containing protein n=1 Tax=Rathayibacter soli TaxID=3144168 RepID=UPI0027E4F345|nr:serine hydrolase domain-containing protein [Glaciibacter superstes]